MTDLASPSARERHKALLAALNAHGRDFDLRDAEYDPDLAATAKVAAVRRARASLVARRAFESRELVLVDRDGVLLWQSGGAVVRGDRMFRRRRGQRRGAVPDGAEELARVRMPVLGPNQYIGELARLDARLNADHGVGLRRVVEVPGGGFSPGARARGPFAGRTLLIVHGTFSSAGSLVGDLASTPDGERFLARSIRRDYDQVLCFDHPTLSVSPFLNAMDLALEFGATSGPVDVIAHSRGGLVVQWWLEVLGARLEAGGAEVRAVLAGSPLRGTSAAAPDKIHGLVNLLTNIGSAVATTATVTAATNPFATVAFGLAKLLGNALFDALAVPPVEDLGARGSLDAAVAVIPGLQGQSAVDNNAELRRLAQAKSALNPRYHAVVTNFETEDVGWKFWRFFRKGAIADAVADAVFPDANDLVVDTAHMTMLGARGEIPADRVLRFADTSGVWHCSYFGQARTIASIQQAFQRP
jgi:hypothetical protein